MLSMSGRRYSPLFFFYGDGDDRALHSFPTRRSSDLLGHGRGGRMKIERDTAVVTAGVRHGRTLGSPVAVQIENRDHANWEGRDRKSTRLNSSHMSISYAVFCLKKKKDNHATTL